MQKNFPRTKAAQKMAVFQPMYGVSELNSCSPSLRGLSLCNRKGRCYELAFKSAEQAKDWSVVHGEVDGPPHIGRIGHAWLELGDMVYNPTDDRFYPCWLFRMKLYAVPIVSYTISTACAMAARFGHFGPWQ